MTYISDRDHNPDFPFAAVGQSGVVYALFKYEEEAREKSRVVNQRYDELKAKDGASNAVIEL